MLAFSVQVEARGGARVLWMDWTMAATGHGEIYPERDLVIYLAARFFSEAAALAQSVAIGWTVYALSNAPLTLGIVGIVQFVPMMLLALPAGELCDRLSPRRVLVIGLALQNFCAVGFLALSIGPQPALWPFYVVLLVFGAARAFTDPAGQALLPFLVPAARLPRPSRGGHRRGRSPSLRGPRSEVWLTPLARQLPTGFARAGFWQRRWRPWYSGGGGWLRLEARRSGTARGH